jgi:peptide subunit release factor 1 (eRF1)
MGNYKYITNRTLLNKAGEEKGSIAVMVPNDSDVARVRYRCPECGHNEQAEREWKRPFSLKCSGCGLLIRLSRLKDEIKKDKKKAREIA